MTSSLNRNMFSIILIVSLAILIPDKNFCDAFALSHHEDLSNEEFPVESEDQELGGDQQDSQDEQDELEKLERSVRVSGNGHRSDFLIRPTRTGSGSGNKLWSQDFLARPTRQQQKGSKTDLSSFFSRPSRSNHMFLVRPTRQGSNQQEPINMRSTSWGGFLSRPTRRYSSQPEPKEITLRSTSWGGFLTRPTKRGTFIY